MTDYAYGPGEWTALAHGGRAALLDPAIDAASVRRIWDSMSQSGSLESWLEVLAGNGLASLPSFGFVEPADDGVRVVVRGSVTGVVEGNEVSAGGMRTWREHVAAAGAGVVLQVVAGEAEYPLVGGVVLAATLQVGDLPEPVADDQVVTEPEGVDAEDGDGAGGDEVAAAAAGGAVVTDGSGDEQPDELGAEPDEQPLTAEESSEVEQPVEVEQLADAGAEAEAEAQVEQEVEPDFVLDDDEDDGESEPEPEPEAAAAPVPPAPEESAGEWAAGGAALLEDLPDGQQAAGEAPLAPPAPQPWAVPAPAEPQANQWGPPSQQAPEQSFEQQPWQPEQPQPQPWQPQEAEAEHVPAELGDHDGYTMRAADLPEPAEEVPVDHTLAPAQEEDLGGEHAAPSAAMQLSLSTGQQVELDRPVLIGRAPESSRFGFGETPRLVTVPSPQQDISRTHVEIKAEGDSVLVTDLRSTNGTVVVLPGSPPRRLHPGESVPVPTGTVIDLGDGVTAVVGLPATAAPIAY